MKTKNIKTFEPTLYVSTYQKYNNGSLKGIWLNLTDFSDATEFIQKCMEIHSDEKEPEFMFQDSDNLPESLYSESFSKDNIESIYKLIDFINYNSEAEAVLAYLEIIGDLDEVLKNFDEAYQGSHRSNKEFSMDFFENIYDIPDGLFPYIDWEMVCNNLMEDFDEMNGYYFRKL
jgi:antirestriction protein